MEELAVIADVALILTFLVLIYYTYATHNIAVEAKKQREITSEALRLQSSMYLEGLNEKGPRFDVSNVEWTGGVVRIWIINTGHELLEWSIEPASNHVSGWSYSGSSSERWAHRDQVVLRLLSESKWSPYFIVPVKLTYRTAHHDKAIIKWFRVTESHMIPGNKPMTEPS